MPERREGDQTGTDRSGDAATWAERRSTRAAAIARVLATIRARPEEPLPLPAMAEIAGFSPFHFAHLFRQETGVPPGQFQAALRMARAKELLLDTDLSVTDVCFAVGYEGLGTFTTRFKTLVGVSPGRLRRLPEEIAAALPALPQSVPYGAPAVPARGIVGQVHAPDVSGTLIFVGLFPGNIPQGRPLAGTMLTGPGAFWLPSAPDGRYRVMAAAVPASPDRAKELLAGAPTRAGRAVGTVEVRRGVASRPVDVVLRPVLAIDPPVVVALPALLLDALATATAVDR